MKKIILLFAVIAALYTPQSFAAANADHTDSTLIQAYYQVKDALVKSDAKSTAVHAQELIEAIGKADIASVDAGTKTKLLADAEAISKSKDIKKQRELFEGLSNHMVELAQKVKLSDAPVYQQYCPMKKASWLSAQQTIKNPYYGNAMLTCGSVKSTL